MKSLHISPNTAHLGCKPSNSMSLSILSHPAVATDESPLLFVVVVVDFLVVVVSLVVRSCRRCSACSCRCLRSNNYSIEPILWSFLFQMTPFLHPRIYQSLLITIPHPPTLFYCPPQSKNGVFIHKITLFTDFRPFFARKPVKYQPIFKWFSFSDSLQQVLQHCRSKFVASQTSLHENNYRSFFRVNSVFVR